LRARENEITDEDLVVIPLPTNNGAVTYAVARLVSEGDRAFAEAVVAVPGTVFAPPRRIALSPHSLARNPPRLKPSAKFVPLRGNDHAAAVTPTRPLIHKKTAGNCDDKCGETGAMFSRRLGLTPHRITQ
jgi:hypothetical protein